MAIYKILYINEVGADFHDNKYPDVDEEAFVHELRICLGDAVEEVQAFVVGIPEDPKRPWYIQPLEVT